MVVLPWLTKFWLDDSTEVKRPAALVSRNKIGRVAKEGWGYLCFIYFQVLGCSWLSVFEEGDQGLLGSAVVRPLVWFCVHGEVSELGDGAELIARWYFVRRTGVWYPRTIKQV